MSAYIPSYVSEFIARHRVARLATADGSGAPHVVPVCYAYDGRHIYSALDLKPKRVETRRLRRVRNIVANPRVALVVDDYSEDWDALAYVLVSGSAHMVEDGERRSRAEAMLRDKYPQYRDLLEEGCAIIDIEPERIAWWGEGLGGGGSVRLDVPGHA
jgi:coenzyme F420-0:L-glutamate ligase/coenzyme F420-1:gamma-L-glutamate ligase